MKYIAFIISITLLSLSTVASEVELNAQYIKQCNELRKYVSKNKYTVKCTENYQHYNALAYKRYYRKTKTGGKIQVAGFNLWHPGKLNTIFKDYEIVAATMNQWDIIGAVELLPVLGADLKHNNKVLKFINSGDELIDNLKTKILTEQNRKRTPEVTEKLLEYRQNLKQLRADLKKAPKLYRIPGYLKILNELRKLDKTWALIIAPRGEAAKSTDVQELAGFFYRSSKVSPRKNNYCEDYKEHTQNKFFGCTPNFSDNFMDKSYRHVFSRPPFMASFESGKFKFTMLTAHIVFNSPRDEDQKSEILNTSFGVLSLDDLGEGANKINYARFAETSATLKFIERYKEAYSSDKNVIYVGDFNLETDNKFWNHIIPEGSPIKVLVTEPTSLTTLRYRSGKETGGYASNYDHFIFNTDEVTACDPSTAQRYDITKGMTGELVNQKYLVRSPDPVIQEEVELYPIEESGIQKLEEAKFNYLDYTSKRLTIRRDQIVQDTSGVERENKEFERRIFLSQQSNKTYYRLYREVVSDHAPITMSCSTK